MAVQGDPNVPAGKVTVKVDLTSALNLTEDEQDAPSVWTPNSSSRQQPSNAASGAVQPFRLPVGYTERTVGGVPSICQARRVHFVLCVCILPYFFGFVGRFLNCHIVVIVMDSGTLEVFCQSGNHASQKSLNNCHRISIYQSITGQQKHEGKSQ